MDRDSVGYAGWRDYSPLLLNLYDPLVVGPIARHVWHCPADRLVARYRQYVRPGHLDVGPGTGYFLARSGLPTASAVTIVDPNPNVLRHARRRLPALDVTAVQASVLEPLPVPGGFRSAALHLVIHCLPGPFERKALAVANVARVLAPDGVFFGASVLGRAGRHSRLARGFLATFNRQGGFDNLDDSEGSLAAMLAQSFDQVELSTIGSIAVFSATEPKATA